MIVDYKKFFNIFMCKDIEELKARFAFLALENRESKEYYEESDSWIEDENLRKRVLKKVLCLQEDLLNQFNYMIQSIEQYENCYRSINDKGLGDWVVTCLVDFFETKKEFEHAVNIYKNYPDKEDEKGNNIHPFNEEYMKKWLKKKFIQSKYKD